MSAGRTFTCRVRASSNSTWAPAGSLRATWTPPGSPHRLVGEVDGVGALLEVREVHPERQALVAEAPDDALGPRTLTMALTTTSFATTRSAGQSYSMAARAWTVMTCSRWSHAQIASATNNGRAFSAGSATRRRRRR